MSASASEWHPCMAQMAQEILLKHQQDMIAVHKMSTDELQKNKAGMTKQQVPTTTVSTHTPQAH